jgi:hypothetical protein
MISLNGVVHVVHRSNSSFHSLIQNHTGNGVVLSDYQGQPSRRRLASSMKKLENLGARERVNLLINERIKKMKGEVSFYDDEVEERLQDRDFDQGERALQNDETLRQKTTFVNCTFKYNTQGPKSGFEKYGVIAVEGVADDLALRSCSFSNNEFGIPPDVVSCHVLCVFIPDAFQTLTTRASSVH